MRHVAHNKEHKNTYKISVRKPDKAGDLNKGGGKVLNHVIEK
jgi:hypothetical protein